MSRDNVAVAERIFELFEAGDIPGIVALQSEDTVWDHSGPPGNPLNKVFNGHDGVREFYEILGTHWRPIFDMTAEANAFQT